MKDSNDPDNQEKQIWHRIRKTRAVGAIMGAIIGLALTILLAIYHASSDVHNYGSAVLISVVSIPSLPLYNVIGLFGLKLNHMSTFNFWLYMIVVNTISYSFVGFIAGWLRATKGKM